MTFAQFEPHQDLNHLIQCYWVVEQDDNKIETQKIIPDGFAEMIFHYRSPYEININGQWQRQDLNLIAGQISNHFYLKNTGKSGMIGIKFMPQALAQLFAINMETLLNRVCSLEKLIGNQVDQLLQIANAPADHQEKIVQMDEWLCDFVSSKKIPVHPLEAVLQRIFEAHGLVKVKALSTQIKISERQLERLFKQYVGLSPKLFCRIIKFNYIFRLIESGKKSWTDLTYSAGYFDQSHFIKNFQEFTGEDPSSYGFDQINMANFFLQPKKA